jgi:hypothetical protein
MYRKRATRSPSAATLKFHASVCDLAARTPSPGAEARSGCHFNPHVRLEVAWSAPLVQNRCPDGNLANSLKEDDPT